LNGCPVTVHSDPATPLLDVLRTELGMTGTKQGCDHDGECGACTVLLNGRAVRSCLTPVGKTDGQRVLSVEGLGTPDELHPLQEAFIEAGAVQCGYCTPGMLLAAKALLDCEPDPSQDQILEALEGNICRCTGYTKIVNAVRLAAAQLRGDESAHALGTGRPAVGGSALRIDSVEKVTGLAQYAEDMVMPGLLYGRVLRSPYHHARLVAVETDASLKVPGVIQIVTAADIPGQNSFPNYSQDEPVLTPVSERLRTVGAPIALIVAESAEAAASGLGAVEVEYEQLPHTFDLGVTRRVDAISIAGEQNELARYEVRHGDLETALTESQVTIETCYTTAWLEHSALERESVLAYLDDAGRITVVAGTHQPHWQQQYIADTLAMPPERIRVVVPPTGGSFGGKQDPWPLVASALMVYHVRRPVRLTYSRRESFDASPKRHPYEVRYKVGADPEGHLTGVRVRIECNTGGYDAHGQYIANYALTASGGAYRWHAVDGVARSVYTNGPKAGQFRGFGTAQSTFALECTLDELAERFGDDPLEFRLRNIITESEPSFLGYPVAESLGYREVLKAIQPHYDALRIDAQEFNAYQRGQALRRGVGLAGMWYRFGKSGSLRSEAHAELTRNGGFVVFCSAPDYGQGINTVMGQMAAEAMGVDRELIEVVNADTAYVPDSGIQGASRATYWVGGGVVAAMGRLRERIQNTAAEMLDLPPAELTVDGPRGVVARSGQQVVSLIDIARELDRIGQSRRVVGFHDLAPFFPQETRPEYVPLFVTGAHVVQAEVNLETGVVRVLFVTAAHDVGRVINPLDAEGQIEGAVLMGLGAALTEEYIPGKSTGFSDYYLPTARSMPEINVVLVEVPGKYGPYGVKGLGEAAMLPSTPAIVNAVSRAIGTRLRAIPATPEKVLAALAAERKRAVAR
jgi:CO/xanthine dehydrogenase Mo-binding subunit/aerobic-type carbon monoxide dehydrogenase small subunit (CoxS/CutS family)